MGEEMEERIEVLLVELARTIEQNEQGKEGPYT
jgi:hypothetical protein